MGHAGQTYKDIAPDPTITTSKQGPYLHGLRSCCNRSRRGSFIQQEYRVHQVSVDRYFRHHMCPMKSCHCADQRAHSKTIVYMQASTCFPCFPSTTTTVHLWLCPWRPYHQVRHVNKLLVGIENQVCKTRADSCISTSSPGIVLSENDSNCPKVLFSKERHYFKAWRTFFGALIESWNSSGLYTRFSAHEHDDWGSVTAPLIHHRARASCLKLPFQWSNCCRY